MFMFHRLTYTYIYAYSHIVETPCLPLQSHVFLLKFTTCSCCVVSCDLSGCTGPHVHVGVPHDSL